GQGGRPRRVVLQRRGLAHAAQRLPGRAAPRGRRRPDAAHGARARDPPAHRRGAHQLRDRDHPLAQPEHGRDPPQADHEEARPPQDGRAGAVRPAQARRELRRTARHEDRYGETAKAPASGRSRDDGPTATVYAIGSTTSAPAPASQYARAGARTSIGTVRVSPGSRWTRANALRSRTARSTRESS